MDVSAEDHAHRSKAVRLTLDEQLPASPPQRASRLVADPGSAGVRLRIEELLAAHHGIDSDALRDLDEAGRALLRRIVAEPAARDYPYRRDAVSALALLADPESVLLLTAIASDPDEDEVIIGRALDGIARIGGRGAL